jgi:hypothetical protein
MSYRHKRNWFRTSMLLVALAAGTLATRFTSEFNEMVIKPYDGTEPRATARRLMDHSSNVTGIDIDFRHLKPVNSTI